MESSPPEQQFDELESWVQGLAGGDRAAIEQVWREYFEKLVSLARRRLESMPRRDQDEEDVALSAMHSFVRGAARQRFPKLQDRDDLWRILVTITARKAVRFKRRRMADKRGGGQVRGESIFVAAGNEANWGLADVLKQEPTAELAVETAEMFRVLYANLQDPVMEQVVLARIEGHTVTEIAEQLGCTTRTVERKLQLARKRWLEVADQEEGAV